MSEDPSTIVIGAGPAGLTAAYLLAKAGVAVTVLEADPGIVGGLSRTVTYRGFRFDVGGHRFFSKSQEVLRFWNEILPDDMLVRSRSSRIHYDGKLLSYPLRAGEVLRKLGPLESARCVCSYAFARAFPTRDPRSFEDWVSNQFGARLFGTFFKSYSEKVWGMSCREVSADWAAQRIQGLSLGAALKNALSGRGAGGGAASKTLAESFQYPRLGPGQLWEACADRIRALGGRVELGRPVTDACLEGDAWTVGSQGPSGRETVTARHLVSSAPLPELVRALRPALSPEAVRASEALRFRDFVMVALIARDRRTFDDNWIYVHDAGLKVARIQNFKSWSPDLVPDPAICSVGLEYFCSESDALWSASDAALLALAKEEIAALGLVAPADVLDGCVVRQRKAYPIYDQGYAGHVERLRLELAERFPTLHLVGRNGMHRYNNQDHSMMTAMLTARNILAGRPLYDVWKVTQDAEYLEPIARAPR